MRGFIETQDESRFWLGYDPVKPGAIRVSSQFLLCEMFHRFPPGIRLMYSLERVGITIEIRPYSRKLFDMGRECKPPDVKKFKN